MLTRADLDAMRGRITDAADDLGDTGEVAQIALALLRDLELGRVRESTLRSYYLNLLTAARATVAASVAEEAAPLEFLTHELAKHGQLPSNGASARQILADARTAQTLSDCAKSKHVRAA